MRVGATPATLTPVSLISTLLLVWSLLLVAGMVGILAGPLAAPARNR
jgi:hypothetical protein